MAGVTEKNDAHLQLYFARNAGCDAEPLQAEALVLRARELDRREKAVRMRERMLGIQQDAMALTVKFQRENIQESKVYAAHLQGVLQGRI